MQSYTFYLHSIHLLPYYFIFIEYYPFEKIIYPVNNKNSYICEWFFPIILYLKNIMKKEYTIDELLHKAASFCSISEHCVSEVEDKLTAWGVSTEDKQKIIDRLISEDFINEKRFCIYFVKDKFRFNKWGKIKITFALKGKRLDKELILNAIETIDDGEYEEMLASLLKTKLVGLKYEFEYEKQGKLFRFAQGLGFENNVIDRVLRGI